MKLNTALALVLGSSLIGSSAFADEALSSSWMEAGTKLTEISYPTVPGSEVPFTFTGSGTNGQNTENGICKALGYASALQGSSRSDFSPAPYSQNIQVNDQGIVLRAVRGWSTSRIICVGPKMRAKQRVAQKLYPLYPGTQRRISFTGSGTNGVSSPNGICKVFGFRAAVADSAESDFARPPYSENIQVNSAGEAVGTPTGWATSSIICVRYSPNK